MMNDTQEGQTNHCPLCEEAGRKLAEAQAEIEGLKKNAELIAERDKLLAEQSSTIELRKEIARLQTTIHGLVAEREELDRQEPVVWVDPQDIPLSDPSEIIYLTKENFDGNTMPLYAGLPVPAVPEGWQLVPKEPSVEMLEAGKAYFKDTWCDIFTTKDHYKIMLKAAPQNGKENE